MIYQINRISIIDIEVCVLENPYQFWYQRKFLFFSEDGGRKKRSGRAIKGVVDEGLREEIRIFVYTFGSSGSRKVEMTVRKKTQQ